MRYVIIVLFGFLSTATTGFAQTGTGDNFNDNCLVDNWTDGGGFALSEAGGELRVDATVSGYTTFRLDFATPINLSANQTVSVRLRSATALTVRIDLVDVNGHATNTNPPPSASVPGSGAYNTFGFDFTGRWSQTYDFMATVNNTQITRIEFFFNPGGNFSGTVYIDDLIIGSGGQVSGICTPPPPWSLSTDIRLNQAGFETSFAKKAVVVNTAATNFYVCRYASPYDTVYTGTLVGANTWSFSGESVKVGDFKSVTTQDEFCVVVPGKGRSYPFSIADGVYSDVTRDAIRAYYYQRASLAISAPYAEGFPRAAGHADNNIIVSGTAATASRPNGTVVNSAKGWYDAGDYGKYTVNSGISTFTLMSAYEHYPVYYDTLDLNIPESGNAVPDILDEVRWNLEWLLTMQDPVSGECHHKLHGFNWPGLIMPSSDGQQRYMVGRSTAGTLDFAAVMAQAARVYAPYDATFAAQCLAAAQSAWTWAKANPTVYWPGGGPDGGGPYNDNNAIDEFTWAAAELYITTGNNTYWTEYQSYRSQRAFASAPDWAYVNTLGLISLSLHRNGLTPVANLTQIQSDLVAVANTSRTIETGSAYRVPMQGSDFVWGSNHFPLNRGMVMLAAFETTSDSTYLWAALSGLDYVLGRNAIGYSYISGHGDLYPLNNHHRPSEADGITEPIPGFLSGGPWDGASQAPPVGDNCGGYLGTNPANEFSPTWCSYASNEVTINWNAPLVFVSGASNLFAAQILPVEWAGFEVMAQGDGVLLTWTTAQEENNSHFLVERSTDGVTFESIGQVSGSGTTSSPITYSFYDASERAPLTYYRIRQVDYDGQSGLSPVRSLSATITSQLVLFPNPADRFATLSGLPDGPAQLSLVNLSGVNVGNWTAEGGAFSLPIAELPAGFYLLQVSTPQGVETLRLIIQ